MMILGHEIETGKPVRINLSRLIETRLLVQANSGGGKSHTLREMLEATHGHVQQIIIDPEGEFSTLREQFDYVYAAPRGGDCLATPQTAELLARRVMELGCSIIIDIYELKAHERLLFAKRFLDALINLPKNLWHECVVVVDEAEKFAPESGKGQAESRQAMIDLASRGRKRGLCAWIATQRSAKLSKDVTAELNNRIMGRATIKEDRKRNAEELGIVGREEMDHFSRLKPGEFFVQGPALSDELSLVKVAAVQTSHPKVGKKSKAAPAPSAKVKKILAELADLPKEAEEEARTIADLKTQVADLKRQLRTAPKVVEKIIERGRAPKVVVKAPIDREQAVRWGRILAKVITGIGKLVEGTKALPETAELRAFDSWLASLSSRKYANAHRGEVAASSPVVARQPVTIAPSVRATTPKNGHAAADDDEPLSGPEQRILDAVAWMESIGVDAPTNGAVAVLAGYSGANNGGYMNPRGRLSKTGLIVYPGGDRVQLTDAGRARANVPAAPPTTEDLHTRILDRLPGPERKILKIVLDAYPEAVDNETIATQAGYSGADNGGYMNPRGRLSSKDLITYPGRGTVRAADFLFLGDH